MASAAPEDTCVMNGTNVVQHIRRYFVVWAFMGFNITHLTGFTPHSSECDKTIYNFFWTISKEVSVICLILIIIRINWGIEGDFLKN